MKFCNHDALMKAGMLPVFNLQSGNALLVLCDKTKVVTKVFIVESGKTLNGFINTSDNQLEDALTNFMDIIKAYYPQFSRKVNIKTKAYAPNPDDMVIMSLAKQSVGGYQSVSYYDRLLSAEGFDLSNLKKSLVVSSKNRDYSSCAFDEEAQAIIKDNESIFSYFTPNIADFKSNVAIAFNDVQQNKADIVIFKGPAGTGKSILAREFAYLMKAPLLQMQCTDGTTADDLMGKAIVNTDPSVEGQFVYALGPVLKAKHKGYQILLDEVNMSQASCINILNQFGDDTNIIEWDGKSYKTNNNCVIYLTMNSGYEGTNNLNAALKSRTIVVDVPRLTKAEFIERIEKYVSNKLGGTLSKDFYAQLFVFTEYMQETSKKYAETVEFCIRNAQKLCASVLTKSCSLDEFTAAVYLSYVDFLSMDNDNTDMVNMLKSSVEMTDHIKKLYDLYDYKVSVYVDESELISYDDILFVDEEQPAEDISKVSGISNDLDDLDDLDSFLNKNAKSIDEETKEEE